MTGASSGLINDASAPFTSSGSGPTTNPVSIAQGGTGATTLAAAQAALGIPTDLGSSPTELQVIATGSALFNSLYGGGPGSAGTPYNRVENRSTYLMGAAATNRLVIAIPGYVFLPSAGDSALGNSLSADAAFELASPVSYQTITFGNQAMTNIPNASAGVFSDALGIYIAGDGSFYVRWGVVSASGALNVLTGGDTPGPTGAAGTLSNNLTSQIQGTGVLSGVNIGGVKIALLLGVPSTPQVAVVFVGDSIADGVGDTATAAGDIGFIMRGLVSVNSHRMVNHKQTVGSQTFSFTTVNYCYKSRGWWKYNTHLICQLGTNDIANSTTLANMQTYAINEWTAAKNTIGPYGKPLKVAQSTIMPRTTSTQYVNTAVVAGGGGGTGYANSATFNVTIAGGTLAAGASATTVSVTTNSSGVVTTVNSVTNNGGYTTGGKPATPNSPTGGAGSGLSLTLTFGGWTSAADQTPVSGFTVGGVRDQFNTWLFTQVGLGLLDAVIDVNPYVEDQSNHGAWITTGAINYPTVDGVHPSSAVHILAAQAVNAWALTQTP